MTKIRVLINVFCHIMGLTLKTDLENDDEIERIRFSSALLDTFDDLGREFILAHGAVEFVDIPSDSNGQ